jgi:hypothetical protein
VITPEHHEPARAGSYSLGRSRVSACLVQSAGACCPAGPECCWLHRALPPLLRLLLLQAAAAAELPPQRRPATLAHLAGVRHLVLGKAEPPETNIS